MNKGMSSDNLKKLKKDGRNDIQKSNVKSYLGCITKSTSISNSGKNEFYRLSSKNYSTELIVFLRETCAVNVYNSPKLFYNRLEAINALIDKNSKICPKDIKHILELIIIKRYILPESILSKLMQKLKECSKDLETLAGMLVQVQCALTIIVYASDARLTQMMLEMPDYKTDDEEFIAALIYVIEQVDFENFRVLWRSDRMIDRMDFLLQCKYSIFHENWNYMRPFFEHLTDWMVLDGSFAIHLNFMFFKASKHELQVLLMQYNVDVQLRQKYNFDVLPMIFANEGLDTEDLMELVFKRQFNVNANKCFKRATALIYAAKINSLDRIQLLLEMGADCNMKDYLDRTPLFYTDNAKCAEALLQNGAKLQIEDVSDNTVLEHWLKRPDLDITKIFLAQLAIDNCQGEQIKRSISDKINCTPICKDHFESCLKQVKEMMNHRPLPSLSLFDIISRNPESIANQIRNHETISKIMEWCSEKSLFSYFSSLSKLNLKKAFNIYQAKCRVASIISKCASDPVGFNHLIIDRICDFLSYNDVLVFLSVSSI